MAPEKSADLRIRSSRSSPGWGTSFGWNAVVNGPLEDSAPEDPFGDAEADGSELAVALAPAFFSSVPQPPRAATSTAAVMPTATRRTDVLST
jgi:hypothetical protein